MLIGILSDTHGDRDATRRAIRIFESVMVELIIHCGDVGANIVAEFSGRPIHFVRGNTDSSSEISSKINGPQQTFHNRFGSVEVNGRSIAFLHGDDAELLRETINSGQWDVVCVGHTHSAGKTYQGRTLVINPGAIHRSYYPSIALLDIASLEVTFIPI